MLFRETGTATIAISQPAHAWLSGQIMRAWGNSAFGTVTPFEDVCLAAEQHDIGWLPWERAPTLNPATGRPHAFRELPVSAHTAIWSEGTDLALTLGRYPAILVSLHGTGLYAAFDLAAASPPDAAVVRAFLDGQQSIQSWLLAGLRDDPRYRFHADPETIEHNRGLVRAADRMSIALCAGMRDLAVRSTDPRLGVVRQVPTAGGPTDIVLRALDDGLTAISVDPWPFAVPVVRLMCEGTIVPPERFQNEDTMRAALRSGRTVCLGMELRPV